jgi:hypothetical protein
MLAENITWISEPDYTHWKPLCQQFISWEYTVKGSGKIYKMQNEEHVSYEKEVEILKILRGQLIDQAKLKQLITEYGHAKYWHGQQVLKDERL